MDKSFPMMQPVDYGTASTFNIIDQDGDGILAWNDCSDSDATLLALQMMQTATGLRLLTIVMTTTIYRLLLQMMLTVTVSSHQ